MNDKILRQSIFKDAPKYSKSITEPTNPTNPRMTAKYFRKKVTENRSARDSSKSGNFRSARDLSESRNSDPVGMKMSEETKHFKSNSPLRDYGSRSMGASNKMSLFGTQCEVIIEEKQDMEQPEQVNSEELRAQTPS
jgi:hypothetical protein